MRCDKRVSHVVNWGSVEQSDVGLHDSQENVATDADFSNQEKSHEQETGLSQPKEVDAESNITETVVS
jgi:hypothetical protein